MPLALDDGQMNQLLAAYASAWPPRSRTTKHAGVSSTDQGGGKRRQAWLDQDARSTLTTLKRGSRSTWMSKTKPSGQVASARRSATVFAVTAIPLSISTLMLSR